PRRLRPHQTRQLHGVVRVHGHDQGLHGDAARARRSGRHDHGMRMKTAFSRRARGDRGGQGGFVLTWIALMLVVLFVFARTAVAEFQGPIPMGSPDNDLGNDPETMTTFPDYWINIAAPNADKTNGDRFSAKNCPSTTYACGGAGPQNTEYATDGYAFAVHV